MRQYKTDRSPKELLFKPNRRAIVHFAFDSETVEMCTWLANGKSQFLPFNKGNGKNGAGNRRTRTGTAPSTFIVRFSLPLPCSTSSSGSFAWNTTPTRTR